MCEIKCYTVYSNKSFFFFFFKKSCSPNLVLDQIRAPNNDSFNKNNIAIRMVSSVKLGLVSSKRVKFKFDILILLVRQVGEVSL